MLLGEELDVMVQKYVKALRTCGTSIGTNMVMAAVSGIVMACDRTLLTDYGGHISITKTWAASLLNRMGYVRRKATTKSTPGMSEERFKQLKAQFLDQISRMVVLRSIPDSLIINLDQTGIRLVPSGDWTMAEQGSRRVEAVGLGDKRQITVTLADCLDGSFLPMQILYQGKTDRSHPKFTFPDGFDIFHSPNHWANEETCLRYLNNIIIPYVTRVREALQLPQQKACC